MLSATDISRKGARKLFTEIYCIRNCTVIDFLGHIISAEGVRADPAKNVSNQGDVSNGVIKF